MKFAWPTFAICGIVMVFAAPAAATCATWRVGPELSLREADGWTMVRLRQDGDWLSGTATRPGRADAAVTGRVQPQRIWLKIAWPQGNQMLEGKIGANGIISGSGVSPDGRSGGAGWEAMEPLQCIATAAGTGDTSGGGTRQSEPGFDDLTRAARDIISVLRGDQPQQTTTPGQSAPPASSSAGSDDPFGSPAPASQSDSSDPFGQSSPSSGGDATDPFGPPPASSGVDSSDPFGPSPAPPGTKSPDPLGSLPDDSDPPPAEYGKIELPPSAPPSSRPSRALPPSALEERPIGSARPVGGSKPMPMILIPIRPISDTCASGFVWREARPSDHVCVPPDARDRVKSENNLSRQFRDHRTISLCLAGYVWREAYAGDQTCVTPTAHDLAQEENRLDPQRKAPE